MMACINLLPWRQRRRRRAQHIFGAQLAASFTAAALLTAAAGSYVGTRVDRQEGRNRVLTAQVAELDGRIVETDAAHRRRDEIDDRASVLARLWRERSATVGIFNELAQAAVAGVHYTELTRRGDALRAQGVAESNDSVSQLMRKLHDSARFTTPDLQSIDTATSAAYGREAAVFTLTFAVTALDEEAHEAHGEG